MLRTGWEREAVPSRLESPSVEFPSSLGSLCANASMAASLTHASSRKLTGRQPSCMSPHLHGSLPHDSKACHAAKLSNPRMSWEL